MSAGPHAAKRADIQELRALAIVLVVAYHAGWLRGGFVGVDVFFVVSGYVIAASERRRREAGEVFSVRAFLLRRATRLVPALAAMLVAVQLLSLAVLSPFGEAQDAIRSSWAAVASVANGFFFLQNGYFEAGEVAVPLLHTWSLSVEEQFYYSFALVLGAFAVAAKFARSDIARRRAVRIGLVALAVCAVASFVGSVLLSRGVRLVPLPFRFAFFGTPVRAWEFIVGVLAALVPVQRWIGTGLRRGATAALAASLVAASVVLSDTSTWPGLTALLPVLATAALMVVGAGSPSRRPGDRLAAAASWVGDRSYGIYLWHFPALVLGRVAARSTGVPDAVVVPIAVTASLLLAAASWRWIERPLQERRAGLGRRFAIVAASVVGCVVVGGGALRVADTGLGLREATVFVEDRTMVVSGCADAPTDDATLARCSTAAPDGGSTLVLVGDSQTVSVHDGVVVAARERGLGVVPIANSGCPFLADPAMGNESCRALLDGAQDVIDERNPDVVVVANAGMRYLGADDRIPEPDGGLPRSLDNRMTSYVRSLLERVESLRRPGRLVVVVVEAPQVTIDSRISLLQRTERWGDGVLSEQGDRAEMWSAVASALAGEPDVAVVDLAGWLCEADRCPVFAADGSRGYFDGTHLSRDGSLALADAFRDVFATVPAP